MYHAENSSKLTDTTVLLPNSIGIGDGLKMVLVLVLALVLVLVLED